MRPAPPAERRDPGSAMATASCIISVVGMSADHGPELIRLIKQKIEERSGGEQIEWRENDVYH